ncbi:MAG: hypothetical protein QXS20_08215 [Candidatus Thorarchaeota archaeon]
MVREIIVLRDTGIPLHNYSVDSRERLDVVVAAFLSAIGSMAETISESQIRTIAFSESKFVWVKKGDLYLVALIGEREDADIYRVILQELSERFVSMFYSELLKDEPDHRAFRSFTDVVDATLQKFDGIPGLRRRHRTASLPQSELRRLRQALTEAEKHNIVHRGAVVTTDGHVIISDLRSDELEAFLETRESVLAGLGSGSEPLTIVHTSLDPVTSFLVARVDGDSLCVFVTRSGLDSEHYDDVLTPFLSECSTIDFSLMRRHEPIGATRPLRFYEYDAVIPLLPTSVAADPSREPLASMPRTVAARALALLRAVDGRLTLAELSESTDLDIDELTETLAILISRRVVRMAPLYPVLRSDDSRFMTYLEVVGMPKRDYEVIKNVFDSCDGTHSLRDIAEKTGVPTSRVLEALRGMGTHVEWRTERASTGPPDGTD